MEKSTTAQGMINLNPDVRAIDNIKGKFILKPTRKTWLANLDPQHDGAVMFSRTFASISPERDAGTGLVKTGLTDQMARELEITMNLGQGTLSQYNNTYWGSHKINVSVPSEGAVIDCDRSALDKLRYCYLKVSSKVATSMVEALENPLYEFVLTSEEAENKNDSEKFMVKKNAYKKLETMNIETQMDFLSVYKQNKYKVTKTSTVDFVTAAIGKVVEEDPKGFLELVEDPNFKDYVFLKKCMSAGLLRQNGTSYVTLGGDVLGNNLEQAVYNLRQPEYNTVKISLLAKLNDK
jgi:hypothetical protein